MPALINHYSPEGFVKMKKKQSVFDHDLWEKLFSALVVAGVMMVLAMLIKFSFEELSFQDVVSRTFTISFLITFHMTSAATGAFFMILLVYYFFYRHQRFREVLTPSLRNYLILFGALLAGSLIYDWLNGWQFAAPDLFLLSFGLGILVSLIILVIGRWIGPSGK